MRNRWLLLFAASLALGCRATIPDDTFVCAVSEDCPPDFSCVNGFCRSGAEPGQDGGPGSDGGMDGGTDARVEPDAAGDCGNGTLDPGEDCDDGRDGDDDDGCTDACEFTCTENADCADTEVCNGAEVCDTTDHTCGDGAPAADGVECGADMVCFTGACITPVCGNSIVEPTEQCDDGMNGDDTDGCTDDCERTCAVDADCLDTNPCNGTETCDTTENRCVAGTALDDGISCGSGPEVCFSAICITPTCSNSLVEPGEDCDTGGASATCDADCTFVACGDGVMNATAGEGCDDGNGVNTDACPDGPGGTCQPASCGDGFIQAGVEACDDGNTSNTDACPSGGVGMCRQPATCGDGFIWTGVEACDDGNTSNTDACLSGVGGGCQNATCGDGFIRTGVETCDDGNGVNTDACPDGPGGTCLTAKCGDGFVRAGIETCDDGNSTITDACPDGPGGTCQTARCGDGYLHAGVETCDDANNTNTDACPDGVGGTCAHAVCGDGFVRAGIEDCDEGGLETAVCDTDCTDAICGDGAVNAAAGEDCDDGNMNDADGCPSGSAGMCRCPPGVPCGPSAFNRAFVTSTTHVPGSLGGTAMADAICNARASAAGLSGTYVAWLSSSSSNVATRLGSASGWVRTDGRPFAASREDLFAGRLLHPLEVDQTGALVTLTDQGVVATGTSMSGTTTGSTCSDWTSTAGQAGGGRLDSSLRGWTVGFLPSCANPSRIYCLGVDHTSPYRVEPVAGRFAFVSTGSFSPDTGRSGADSICQAEATAAGLPGTYRALLATSTASAISRFSTSGAPWVRVDGVPLLDDPANLPDVSSLATRLTLRADGTAVTAQTVWTGAPRVGEVGVDTCLDWSSIAPANRGHYGRPDVQVSWFGVSLIGSFTASCDSSRPVYCFQQ